MSEGWLADLNEEQRAAVLHGAGPLLIVAGAGTGKTRTIAYRVAHLLQSGVPPDRILLLTFTRRAAEEMTRRAWAAVESSRDAQPPDGRIWGGTFHSVGNRLLRIYGQAGGLSPDFTVMDESDAEDLLNLVRQEAGFHSTGQRFPRKQTCLAIYSRCVNGSEPLKEVLGNWFPWCAEWEKELKQLFRGYVERKQAQNVLDYDDLLLCWHQLLQDSIIAERMDDRFEHILVDEYQDTNRLQAEILKSMRRKCRNITVVGDDAQSIYSFRAATVRNILEFPSEFPGAQVLKLTLNYRSVPPILETTNRLIAEAAHQYTKNLRPVRTGRELPKLVTCPDEEGQNGFIIARVLEHLEAGIPLRKQAVLFRAAYLSDTLEVDLTRRNIPFRKYGGLRFLEAAHVKDMIAFLRIPENHRDQTAWFRVLQLIDGIGPAAARKVLDAVSASATPFDVLPTLKVPRAAAETWPRFCALLQELGGNRTLEPATQVEKVRQLYDPIMKQRYENPAVRSRDLQSLEQIASGYRSRGQFLSELQLDPPSATSDLAADPSRDEDWLTLSTIHSAKGCEWDVVFLVHASDGFLPSDMATGSTEEIEEERRLAYVAMTRARDFLYVTWPLRYYKNRSRFTDRHVFAQPSRFLTQPVAASMEPVVLEGARPGDGADTVPGAARPDVRKNLRAMWD